MSHESPCRWDVPPRHFHPEPRFIPVKLPSYMAGMESARRSPVTPSPGSSSMDTHRDYHPHLPYACGGGDADEGVVVLTITLAPVCPAAGGGVPAPWTADPRPRVAAHRPRLLSSGSSMREGACLSMCD